MSLGGRLRLDEVITSMPELGPTLPDGGYSWIVLVGIMAIQMTVPSISSMYGVILGYLAQNDGYEFNMWTEKIALTPILFTGFWSVADPWTRIIVNLASVPRLVGLVGISLLSIGVLASGYLASGGVGAYLANLSAGAVMGIGISFVLIQSENVLRRHFRKRLRLAVTLRNLAQSIGNIVAPGFVFAVFSETDLHPGSMMMACIFAPAILGTMALRGPQLTSLTSPYTLLLSDEDNELTSRVRLDVVRDNAEQEIAKREDNLYVEEERTNKNDPPLIFAQGSNDYNFDDRDEHFDVFVAPSWRSNAVTWKQEIRVFRIFTFWIGILASVGTKVGALFLWILLPSLAITRIKDAGLADGVALSVVAGVGTVIPNVAAYWRPNTARWRSFLYGGASWLGGFVLLGLSCNFDYAWFLFLAFVGGVSVGGSAVTIESVLQDALGAQPAKKAHTILCTLVGFAILLFSFVESLTRCLQIAALLQFAGGTYWVVVPCFGSIKAR